MPSQDEARQKLAELVEKYQKLTTAQRRDYNEENTKKDFILPLFAALGWDVYESKEVAAEEKASKGRVDYAFKLKGVSRFYLEAKPLRADLNDPQWAKQAITYAYNKGVAWAVLTNFASLQAFNAQRGVVNLAQARFPSLTCQDYLADFDKLWLLSRESTEAGRLDAEAAKLGVIPAPLSIEKRLFEQLRRWRQELSTQLHHHNPHLTFEHIDEAIQRLFNRLIFIRAAEDRGLEEHELRAVLHQWRGGGRKGELIAELRRLFRKFDGYYDSDLFALHLCDQVFIEAPTLEGIIEGLYDLPGGLASYDFAVIDADVLGQVYEQYLGYVSVEVKRRAQEAQQRLALGLPEPVAFDLEAKQAKRKAEGIYYTPKWVVDYIVQQTVGRFLKERTHDEILNIKILDPACGSGSFLIRAYDMLLEYHAGVRGKAAAELDWTDRLPILTNNIFGVDLDPQAVEIARLNLLIRALAKRELLPSLADNIRCGNSLIAGGEAELRPYFGDGWEARRPFTWEQEFPQIMARGGFDVVVGNPPYVRIQGIDRLEADYFRATFDSAHGSFDISVLFAENGARLLKGGGRLGFITSGKFLKAQYGEKLQELLMREATVETIVDLSAQTVFAEATTYPAIVVLQKGATKSALRYVAVGGEGHAGGEPALDTLPSIAVPQEAIKGGVWPPPSGNVVGLLRKMESNSDVLGKLSANIFTGLQTSADKIYILEKRSDERNQRVRCYSKALEQEVELEAGLLKPLLSGKDVDRFVAHDSGQLLLFPYLIENGKATLIPAEEFQRAYPLTWAYLLANRQTLEDREGGKMRHERWYAFGRTQSLGLHDFPKLAIPRLVYRLQCFYDYEGKFYLDNVDVGGVILKDLRDTNYKFVTALLNSKLLDWYFWQISAPFRGDYRSANRQFIEKLPIRRITFDDPGDRARHDALVAQVERMLDLNRRLAPLRGLPSTEREDIERAIAATDRQLDDLVYDLYGLTAEERAIVEGETPR